MDQNTLKELLKRYHAGQCTDTERALLEDWYNREGVSGSLEIPKEEIEEDVQAIRKQLPVPGRKPQWTPRRYAAAVALIALLGGGLYFYFGGQSPVSNTQPVVASDNDIMPGGNKATLTLADGSQIQLDDQALGTIARQSEHTVVKSEDGQIVYRSNAQSRAGSTESTRNTIRTPRGGQYHVTLPDGGTQVWLNAASSLTYNTSYIGDQRVVHLEGEGYFEVAPDPDRPFRVITDNQVVEVLGTHFNINSYPDEPVTKTTLLEGSVRLKSKNAAHSVTLKPGEQAALSKANQLSVRAVTAADAVAWKEGLFRFNNSDIEVVMRQLSRWYDVEVEFEGEKPDVKLWGEVYRNVNASQALEMLTYFKLKYRIETKNGVKKIIIYG